MKDNKVIHLDDYVWYGFNRKGLHQKAPKGSGGVGFFVRRNILQQFKVHIADRSTEGILALMFTHKTSQLTICVTTGYLPPENSPWGRDAEFFYSNLLTLIYNLECDNFILCGDLNSRIGSLHDYVENVDDIPPRIVIDNHVNQHGRCLVDFLHKSKMCIINGRLNPTNNDYTSTSSRGTSVVDYIIVPQNTLSHFKNFNVKSCMSIVEDHNLFSLLNERSRIPDHAVLLVDLSTNIPAVSYETFDNSGTPVINPSVKYNYKIIPEEFLNNEKAKQFAHSILDQINVNNGNQEDFDFIYDNICSFINKIIYAVSLIMKCTLT